MDRCDTLLEYPYVVVRVRCDSCNRRGKYRLARLVDKFGADFPLDELIKRLAHATCGHRPENQRKGKRWAQRCTAYFPDLDPPQPPPDIPDEGRRRVHGKARLWVIASGRKAVRK